VDLGCIVKSLTEANGVAGFEGEVQGVIRALWSPFVDEFRTDALGNLIALRRGSAKGAGRRRSVMIAAHCDEIGLMVAGLEKGFLRVTAVGGIDRRVLPGMEVLVHGRRPLPGVIGLRPPHVLPAEEWRNPKPVPMEELFVDVGLSEDEARQWVSVGDPISFRVPAVELENERVAAKALDNRASVAAAAVCLETLLSLRHEWDVYVVATAQEEKGLRGAIVAAFGVAPDIALAVDVTFGIGPGVSESEAFALDEGPAVGIGPNVHPAIHEALMETARALEMHCQVEPMPGGSGTDAWAIQVAREGIPTGVLSIPVQNMHTPVEVVSLKDIRRTGRLIANFIAGLDESFAERVRFPLPA